MKQIKTQYIFYKYIKLGFEKNKYLLNYVFFYNVVSFLRFIYIIKFIFLYIIILYVLYIYYLNKFVNKNFYEYLNNNINYKNIILLCIFFKSKIWIWDNFFFKNNYKYLNKFFKN